MKKDFSNSGLARVFAEYPDATSKALLIIRDWVFEISKANEGIGEIEECLKWECPSYLTHSPKSGTTLRLSQLKSDPYEYALSVHCQTTLVGEFREIFPQLKYDKNRSIIFDSRQPLQADIIKQFIYLALTYHMRKN